MQNVEFAIPLMIQKGLVEECGFGVFDDWVFRRVFGPEGTGYLVTGGGRKLCNEELIVFFTSYF
jgi:hypothetical protein